MKRSPFVLWGAALGVAAVGCGSAAPVPHAQMASSAAAIRGAEEVGARNEPRAALHLSLAREQHSRAAELIRDGKNKDAARLLMRAESDAEVAIALAKEARTRAAAQKTLSEVRDLQSRL